MSPTLSPMPPPRSFAVRVHLPSLHTWLQRRLLFSYLDGLHRVILVQFVDVVSYAGVERGGRNGVDDGGIVGLLLVPLAVGVDKQRKKAAQDGAAEPHGDHVEQVELWEDNIKNEATLEKDALLPSSVGSEKKRRTQWKAPHSF